MSRPTPKVSGPPEDPSLADPHADNAAVRELLDHMAEQLAEEYIGLKKKVASRKRKDQP